MSTDTAPSGILVINKPAGITSFDVVARIRRLYGTRQVGHTGTLDPMATGVLPVLVGRAVKASDFIVAEDKSYVATLRLGLTTDTEDTTGRVLTTSESLPDVESVKEAAASFVGEILQTPPMYSALKVNGQKLVDLARRGVTVERAPRPVCIHRIELEPLAADLYRLNVDCSKGTYIRTLCADIGAKLGVGGVMASLVRTKSGPFALDQGVTLEELEALSVEERGRRLLPLESFFADCPYVHLPPFYARLAGSGCEIYLSKIGVSFPDGTLLRMYRPLGNGWEFFALGRVGAYPDGPAVKPVKQFVLM